MTSVIRTALLSVTFLASGALSAAACTTADADACETATGTYRMALPASSGDDSIPAVMFLHGAGGTGQGVLNMRGVINAITARGYAVIAPDGLQWRQGRNGGSWSFLPADQREVRRDEPAFFADIIAQVAETQNVDPDRVLLAGFSAGGFMVNYLACGQPDAFAAYAPVSGGFWRPHPAACEGPVKLFHTHGFRDSTVPLEGRPLRSGQWLQGDIFEGLGIWRAANGCEWPDPDGYRTTDQFERRYWDCMPGSALEFALFPGGHGVPQGWADMALDWFEDVTAGPEESGGN